ncbi:MAG: FAD-dependent oxidoreductase [Thermodesulfobacteriota bacterium]
MNREKMLAALQSGQRFDLLVIGGGATGCGVALDAATRGLNVALVERGDFAQGTSSKSTKLVHGGVRYLEKAVLKLDKEQFDLVREGLRERGRLLRNAPHLAHAITLMTPMKTWFQALYMFVGLIFYDLLSGSLSLGRSRIVSARKARELFPQLDLDGYVAAVVYYDGQFNDARMAVALARTAAAHGAAVANHVEAAGLVKEGGKVRGAILRDRLTGREWTVAAKGVVNATGPFADAVRRMDDPSAPDMLKVSSGIHILLDAGHAPPDMSLMIPGTEDGRVLFMIPWQGHVLFGTTDEPAEVENDPAPLERDVEYLLRYASKYLRRPVTREDVLAVWSGLRPLVFAPGKTSTQELARSHIILQSPSGLLTISGGKWTSYRAMAEEAVDEACARFGLDRRESATADLRLIGSRGYVAQGWKDIMRDHGLDEDVARSIHELYGDEAGVVADMAGEPGMSERIHPAHPFIAAEVVFSARYEMAARVSDMLLRRLPLGLLDMRHAMEAAGKVAGIMARELGWSDDEAEAEAQAARELLKGWLAAGLPGGRCDAAAGRAGDASGCAGRERRV